MSKAMFTDIFGMYLPTELQEILKDCLVEKCELNIDERTIKALVRPENYINKNIKEAEKSLYNAKTA